jgi:RNA 3'-terminal phosphate cyclase (ATP)
VFCAFGERGVRAEMVAEKAVAEARRYLDAGVPVGEHLADQVLVPMALGGGGAFKTLPLSLHARTNIDVIKMCLGVEVRVEEAGDARIVALATPSLPSP